MKKIGIMGGTFNPIHNAHLMMAQAAYEQFGLDEIWFMPSKNPPHKKKSDLVSDEHRKRMVQFAIDDIPHFRFSDVELAREGITYTSDTLAQLHGELPDVKFYFILGGDSLEEFEHWHEPEQILKYATVLAAPRGHLDAADTEKLCKKQAKRFGGKVKPLAMNTVRISSEQIRGRLKEGQSALAYCPEKVVHYIRLHGLYDSIPFSWEKGKAEKLEKRRLACLMSTLRPKRYLHTLGVAYTAASLAFCHGVEPERAELAGLLHDCAKYYTGEEMLALCEEYGISLTDTERANTALIHGKLGAYLAEKRYGVKDEEILSAIRCHTTGKPDMTTLEKIIYVADYIEPKRHMDCEPYSLEQVRKECFRDLDEGLFQILSNSICYLENSSIEVDDATMQTYEYYTRVKSSNERRACT